MLTRPTLPDRHSSMYVDLSKLKPGFMCFHNGAWHLLVSVTRQVVPHLTMTWLMNVRGCYTVSLPEHNKMYVSQAMVSDRSELCVSNDREPWLDPVVLSGHGRS